MPLLFGMNVDKSMNIFLCTLVTEVCECTPETQNTCCSILEGEPFPQALQYTVSIASKSRGGGEETSTLLISRDKQSGLCKGHYFRYTCRPACCINVY